MFIFKLAVKVDTVLKLKNVFHLILRIKTKQITYERRVSLTEKITSVYVDCKKVFFFNKTLLGGSSASFNTKKKKKVLCP